METSVAELEATLARLGILFERFDHDPVYTCDDVARIVPAAAGGVQTKNLFVRDKKGQRHWLVVTDCSRAVDLKALAPVIGADHLSLGSPDRLMRCLGVSPGSVTLLALVNDPERQVGLVIDREVWEAAALRCHPLTNTATLVISRDGIARFLEATGHQPLVTALPLRTA
jgi:Ala-tRNA(Pro) deacylase